MFDTALLSAALVLASGDIAWEGSYDAALKRARDEGRVVFVAVNMDGERANDRMVKDVYTDKSIVALAGQTVNLIASAAHHSESGTCPRFGGISCKAHRDAEQALREEYLRPAADGQVVAPQHLFLDPEGNVLLSVVYGVRTEELEWCFVTALKQVDPDTSVKASARARAPRRVVLGATSDPAELEPIPSRAEVEEIAKELKKGTLRGSERMDAVLRLLLTDDPVAIETVLQELRAGPGGARGGGRGGGERNVEQKARILHRCGVVSPAAYWAAIVELVDSSEDELRHETIAALEQLAAPESLKDVRAALKKTKEPRAERGLLRALGSAGAADKGVRAELLKRAEHEQDSVLRINAVLALGHLTPHDEVATFLGNLLADPSAEEDLRVAAACAMALTRAAEWKTALEPHAQAAQDTPLKAACVAAVQALEQGSLSRIEEPFVRVSRDEIVRERYFGPRTTDRAR